MVKYDCRNYGVASRTNLANPTMMVSTAEIYQEPQPFASSQYQSSNIKMSAPLRVIVCGQTAQVANSVKAGLLPEYESETSIPSFPRI